MVESHFGLAGPAFQLNPDPAFYFDSRGHAKALAYLRYGVQQGEGFIVITGDAGTGKTTLVRTLLQQLDARTLVAAQLSNTQLDATDLLVAILAAFGVRPAGTSKAAAISTVEAFLTSVAAGGRRALLVVDEAQNLSRPALEELRMLSNFQLGHHGLLQTFLVGQPPLRDRLQSPDLEQLRQRVLASCHLEALDADETAGYVLHRLRRVGWAGRPGFDDAALAAVHRHSGGVPRRINVLCNRVLLAACLADQGSVTATQVDETAGELLRELRHHRAVPPGERGRAPAPAPGPASAPAAPGPGPGPGPGLPSAQPVGSTGVDAVEPAGRGAAVMPLTPRPAPVVRPPAAAAPAESARRLVATEGLPVGAWIGLAETALGWAELRHLAAHAAADAGRPPLVCCHPGARESLPAMPAAAAGREVHLAVADGVAARLHAERVLKFGAVLGELRPAAVLVSGTGLATLQCAMVARELGFRLVRLDAGDRVTGGASGAGLAALIDRCADVLCVDTLARRQALAAEGLPARRVVWTDGRAGTLRHALRPLLDAAWRRVQPRLGLLAGTTGHGLISAQLEPTDVTAEDALQWLMLARHASRPAMPWCWPVRAETERVLSAPALRQQLHEAGITVVRCDDWLAELALLRDARCVIAGPAARLAGEAVALGVPTVQLDLHAEPRELADDGPLVRLGPSASQLKEAMQRLAEARRRVEAAATLDDAGGGLLDQLVRRLDRPQQGARDAAWNEEAA